MTDYGAPFMGSLPHDCSDSAFGPAVGDIHRERYPVHTATRLAADLSTKARECTVRTAENILAGHLSAKTITRLVRAYGLGLLIDAGARVTGNSLEAFIQSEALRARHEQQRWEREAARFTELQAALLTRDAPALPGGDGVDGGPAQRSC